MSFYHIDQLRQKEGNRKINEELVGKFGCDFCNKNKGINSPNMQPTGVNNPYFYILGWCPGEMEDKQGEPFVGKSGKYLRKILNDVFTIREVKNKFRFNNCVRCRLLTNEGKNKKPTENDLVFCRKSIEDDIKKSNPKVVIGLGDVPFFWFTRRKDKISLWRGRHIPVGIDEWKGYLYPTFHPSYPVREEERYGYNEIRHCFEMDYNRLNTLYKSGVFEECYLVSNKEDIFEGVKTFDSISKDELCEELADFANYATIAIDIENRPLRPYYDDAKIISIGISNGVRTISFPYRNEFRDIVKTFLLESKLKICHNLQHELEWFLKFFGPEVLMETQWGDTMVLGFLQDERKIGSDIKGETGKGALGLEDMTFINFGFNVKDYSPINYSDFGKNTLHDYLVGCALDSKWTCRLYHKNRHELDVPQRVYDHHIAMSKTLVFTQARGLCVDFDVVNNIEDGFRKEVQVNLEKIKWNEDIKKYEKIYGEFNPGSDDNVHLLFIDMMKLRRIESKKQKRGYTLDKKAMAIYAEEGVKIAQYIAEYRSLVRSISVYGNESFGRRGKYVYDDLRTRTNFNHLFSSTGRLTSSHPNLQNLNKRSKGIIRNIIVAPDNHWIVPIDFSQIEAIMLAVVSRDKNFRQSLLEGHDVHMYWAKRVASLYPKCIGGRRYLSDKAVMKKLRAAIKNQLVFPWFYGASLWSVGKALGIPEYIIKEIWTEFWKMYPEVKKWQSDLFKFYLDNGFIESKFGRRRHYPMEYTQVGNTTIQGIAADKVKEAMWQLCKDAYETGKEQYIAVLNIHDDLTFYIPDKSLEEDILFIVKRMVDCSYPWDFIDIPLSVEVEVGKSWGNTKPLMKLSTFDFN